MTCQWCCSTQLPLRCPNNPPSLRPPTLSPTACPASWWCTTWRCLLQRVTLRWPPSEPGRAKHPAFLFGQPYIAGCLAAGSSKPGLQRSRLCAHHRRHRRAAVASPRASTQGARWSGLGAINDGCGVKSWASQLRCAGESVLTQTHYKHSHACNSRHVAGCIANCKQPRS